MKMLDVQSSQIKRIGHESSMMRVEFKSGAVWEYHPVSANQFADIYYADSVGSAFNKMRKSVGLEEKRIS